MNKIAVLGLGKVGTLVGLLLNELFNVVGYDMSKPHYKIQYPFPCHIADISKTETIREVVEHVDAVVSALPYNLNRRIATIAHQKGIHYFDLTEDVSTMHHIKTLGENASSVLAPQCGLAPGLIGVIGGYLASKFDKLRDIELRVGALPRYPNGQLSYSFTWSSAGVLNEYLNDAEAIQNGARKILPRRVL